MAACQAHNLKVDGSSPSPAKKNQFSYDCGLEAQNVMMWYMRIPRELDKVKNSQTLTTVVIREKRGEAVTVD